jgi:hypothetical protein
MLVFLQMDPIADREECNALLHVLSSASREPFTSVEEAIEAFRASGDHVLELIRTGRIAPETLLVHTGPRLTPEGGADTPTGRWGDGHTSHSERRFGCGQARSRTDQPASGDPPGAAVRSRRVHARGTLPRSVVSRRHQMRRRSVAQRVISWRLESWSLRSTEETWVSTVLMEMESLRATCL